uniref:(northern house mosquito) hypothetical protein n=1 Tax=Culex pipiens TaxID=7175 RepID=A0A8D8ASG6_CULPI
MLTNDSGNESEERLESLFFDHLDKSGLLAEHNPSDSDAESDIYSKVNEFDVVFHDPTTKLQQQIPRAELLVDERAPPLSTKPRGVRRVLTSDNSTDSCTSSIVTTSGGSAPEDETAAAGPNKKLTQINTCKILQRKLELKVERAKRNYRQMYEEQDFSQDPAPKSAPMIPISRLSIPGGVLPRDVQQPLVDVAGPGPNSDDEDDLEQVSFFPRPMKKSATDRQELSDTFSIQEMTIESDQEDEAAEYERCRKLSNSKGYKKILNRGLSADGGDYLDNDTGDFEDDDDDSQNLELLPPKSGYNLKEFAQRAFCCFRRQDFLS